MCKDINSNRVKPYIDPFKWCRYILNTGYLIVAFVILAHVIWYFAARKILAHPADIYLRNYILLPAVGLFALVIFIDLLVRSPRIPLLVKETLSLSLFFVISFYLCLTHPIAKVLLGSFILVIFASTVFSNLKLTRLMFWLSNFAVLLLGIISYFTGKLDGDLTMQFFVAWFMFLCAYLLAKILIQYSRDNLVTLTNFDTTQKYMQEQLKLDPFTGLSNRKTFDDSLQNLFDESQNSNELLALAMIDVDNFKNVNDLLGHVTGDRVLLYLSQILKNIQTENIRAFRVGGDEFSVIFKGCSSAETYRICEEVRAQMRTFPLRATDNNRISISCGIVSITPNIANPEMLIKAADSALYAAKNEGRNQVVIKTGELH